MRRSAIDRIFHEMQEIRHRLDEIEKSFSTWRPQPLDVQESDLLLLPDHLRSTYLTTISQGECDATQVSNLTGRCRAIESNYLNQLTRTGWLLKRRDSKNILFRPVSRKTFKAGIFQKGTTPRNQMTRETAAELSRRKDYAPQDAIRVRCLSIDYDGTIGPLHVSRNESHVPLETRAALSFMSRFLPITVLTMKDLHFIMPRTPFAHAWSAIGGLETRIGKRVLRKESIEPLVPTIAEAVDYAKKIAIKTGIEIEEKQDSLGRTLAFCVDWRQTKNQTKAKEEALHIATHCKDLGLCVLKYQNEPFCDVCPTSPDKGGALREILKILDVKNGAMYLGDSPIDNSAFENSSISVGIIHDESRPENLNCDYLVKFENMPEFLRMLIARNYEFSPDFSMVTANSPPSKRRPNCRAIRNPSNLSL